MNQTNANAPLRASLQALPRALRTLHKALIDVETVYFGAVGSPLEHLQLITNHPHFAWLQPMSALMAALDEALDEPETLTSEAIAGWRAAIEELVGPGTAAGAFRTKYVILLHDAPDVAIAHGALRQLLGHLPRKG
ncbi:hypothetical protein INH39_29585 [Massilia violaceinigra]|uniref:Uncharacterized protein n=1 Tax=Massilia violaceinigra TaxID=2045208 RepID=A0ABY4A665_9BURK|nr:hypothetical protein [Massilia violaceinigra]UOD29499.1 hypothetical protein INH39_29585 [Massilia violaceinigra]